jgi:hypothetical protein
VRRARFYRRACSTSHRWRLPRQPRRQPRTDTIRRRLSALGKIYRFNDLPWNPAHRDIQGPLQGVLRSHGRPVQKAAALSARSRSGVVISVLLVSFIDAPSRNPRRHAGEFGPPLKFAGERITIWTNPIALNLPLIIAGVPGRILPRLVVVHRTFDGEEALIVIDNDEEERRFKSSSEGARSYSRVRDPNSALGGNVTLSQRGTISVQS